MKRKKEILAVWMIVLIFFLPAIGKAGTAFLIFDPPQTNADGSALIDLAGYKAYWGISSGNYTNSLSVARTLKPQCQICTNNISSTCGELICITGLNAATTYYFTVTAYDVNGNESDYAVICAGTADVSKTMPAATNPIGNVDFTSIGSANRVDGFDLIKFSAQFGLSVQELSGQCTVSNMNKWLNNQADIIDLNGDGRIDGFDLIILSANFGKTL